MHTKTQLPRLPGSYLKCSHICGGGGFLPIIIPHKPKFFCLYLLVGLWQYQIRIGSFLNRICNYKQIKRIPLASMGVLAPCPRTRDPPLSPPSALAEIFRHACLQSRFHQISPFSGQTRVNWGCSGNSPNVFFIGFLIFLLLRSPWKIPNL